MKKFAYLAAAAAIALTPVAASAATSIEVGRQTLLDNGSAPQTLRYTLSGAATAMGTHSMTCSLAWVGAAPTGTGLDDFTALNVSPGATLSSSAPVTGTVALTYSGRINPKGMAVGDAIYTGSFDANQTAGSNVSGLSCPNGATVTVGFRAGVPGNPGQPFIAAVAAQDAVYGTKKEPVCFAAAQADPKDDLIPGHCPDITDYTNLITPAVEAVAGQDYIAPTAEIPEVPAQTVTYTYQASNYSFTQSGLTVVVDGYTFSY